ncbi:MAG TPA: tRNA dimethylallyltransferase, partial [Myxococcota bacterium]|nr:tRNA dimethylallyltransferase [Myxococcota bacterium]
EVLSRLARLGSDALHIELAQVDPEAAARISPRDPQRVTRALEVHLATGTPITTWQRETTRSPGYQSHIVAIELDREVLGQRIAARAAAMVASGLIDEVRALLTRHPPDCPGLSTLGYREVVAAILSGELDESALTARLTTAHRQYAKRQQTWFARAHADTRLPTRP